MEKQMSKQSKAVKAVTKVNTEPVFQTTPIRLSADETRLIIRLSNCNGTSLSQWQTRSLIEMGIIKQVTLPYADTNNEQEDCWTKIRRAAEQADSNHLRRQLDRLTTLTLLTQKKEVGYVLTDLGKAIARGITVRLNSQFIPKNC